MGAAAGQADPPRESDEPAHDLGAAPDPPSESDEPAHDLGAAPDSVEQVQRALLTLIGAARVVLDAAEALVADRRRLDELAASGRDLVGTLKSAIVGSHEGQGAASPSSGSTDARAAGDAPAAGDGATDGDDSESAHQIP